MLINNKSIGGASGGGGSMTASEIKIALETLSGDSRLDASAVKNVAEPQIDLIEEKIIAVAAATVDFTSLDLSTYHKVELHIRKLGCTTGSGTLRMRLNDVSTANYSNTGQVNQTSALVGNIYSDVGFDDISHEIITFYEPSKTDERRKWTAEGQGFGANLTHFFTAGILEGGLAEGTRNASITKISLFSSSGNISVGSEFLLIGYKYAS